jgi:K+-transporting ATPase ATPase C chain
MKKYLNTAIRLTLICIVFFSVIYTLAIWSIAQLTPNKGNGEIITKNKQYWYVNIGQRFTEDKYFWSRPSQSNYDASISGGSNKAPSNSDYLAQVQMRIDTFLVHNPSISQSEIPVDIITESGSGLDPDISVKAALIQVNRIAKTRNISIQTLTDLVADCTESRLFDCIGTSKVNVLKLNLALDELGQ